METNVFYSSFDPALPNPIAFNGWKHHLGFLAETADISKTTHSCELLANHLASVRGSVLDVYTGKLTCKIIAKEIIQILKDNQVLDFKSFKLWLHEKGDNYREFKLNDGSAWTLTLGRFSERYVHIHPSRYSQHTIRLKPSTLKSAFAYFCFFGSSFSQTDTDRLNSIRLNLFGLSPVKRITIQSQFLKMLKIIGEFVSR